MEKMKDNMYKAKMNVSQAFFLSNGSTLFVGEIESVEDSQIVSTWKMYKNGLYIEDIPIISENIPTPRLNHRLRCLETSKKIKSKDFYLEGQVELILF